MNTIKFTPINQGHKFGDPANNYVLTLGQDPAEAAPQTKDFATANEYYYYLTEYCKQYIEKNGYGEVINSYNPKFGNFYHFNINLNNDTACKGGIMVNEFTSTPTQNSLGFKVESCNLSGCLPFQKTSPKVDLIAVSTGMGEVVVDWSQRSKVVTIRDSAIFGIDNEGVAQFLDNVPAGTLLGYANGKDNGIVRIRTFEGMDIFINADSVQFQG